MSTYLMHHGIKGQKWGVRRFENPDGTLTNLGKARRRIADKVSGVKKSLSDKQEAKIQSLTKQYKYKDEYLTDRKAREKAERRVQIEKVLAVTAAVTVTAIVASAAYRNYKSEADQIIKAGTSIQRIKGTPGSALHEYFYGADNKTDKQTYTGLLGTTRHAQNNGHSYSMDIEAKKDLRIAGDRNARKIFKDLYKKDEGFRNYADWNYADRTGKKSASARKVYDQFNRNLHDRSNGVAEQNKKFYDAIKKAGYNGLQDVNDKKYSGYNAKNPVIYINTGKEFAVKSVKELEDTDMGKAILGYNFRKGRKAAVETVAKYSSVGLAGMLTADYIGDRMTKKEETRREEEKNRRVSKNG